MSKSTILGIIVTGIAGILAVRFGWAFGLYRWGNLRYVAPTPFQLTISLLFLTCGLILISSSVLMTLKKRRLSGFLCLFASVSLVGIIGYLCSYAEYRYIHNEMAWNGTFLIPLLGIIGFITTQKAFEKARLIPFVSVLIAGLYFLPLAVLAFAHGSFLHAAHPRTAIVYPLLWISAGLHSFYLMWSSYKFSLLKNGLLCGITILGIFSVDICRTIPAGGLCMPFLLDPEVGILLSLTSSVALISLIIATVYYFALATKNYLKKGARSDENKYKGDSPRKKSPQKRDWETLSDKGS